MTHIEIEYKTLLTKGEFHQLSTLFSHISPVTQTNYYFDSEEDSLKNRHMSLRIRKLPMRAELTLKSPSTVGNLEHNLELSLEEAATIIKTGKLPDGEILSLLKEAGVSPEKLRNFGSLTTIRREMQTPIGLMALDKNLYHSVVDYELELEVTDPEQGKNDFDTFLAEHCIGFKYAKSKIARLVSILNQDNRITPNS